MTQDEKKNESKSKPDAMTQNGNESERKSKVDILIDKIDAIFIKHGLGGKSVWEDPEPNQHIILFRLPIKMED